MSQSKTYNTLQEWMDAGAEIFGTKDFKEWRWKCPSCGRIQSIGEFKEFKDKGADPNDAYQKCLGRFTGGRNGPHKCDWAAFGLFSGPDFVMNDGKQVAVFSFAPPVQKSGGG